MKRIFIFAGWINQKHRSFYYILSLIPFLVMLYFYFEASQARLAENPQDKLLPSVHQMGDAIDMMAFTPDKRSGEYLLLQDTIASLKRLGIGVGLSAFMGLFLGLACGLFFSFQSLLMPFVTFISIIPPLAMLPILFILFGVDELSKVMLIFIGIAPIITRDIYSATAAYPIELLTKAMTLGAGPFKMAFRIILPQLIPRLLETIRLSLGSAWLFLIAAEAIASTDGLGYRIFLVRRYMAMDIIIPYVFWITFIGFVTDFALAKLVKWRYPWYLK
jgi:NitT/TauT family transport system permease protein